VAKGIEPKEAAPFLRILADRIDNDEISSYLIVSVSDEEYVRSVLRIGERPYLLMGVLENIKIEINSSIEEE